MISNLASLGSYRPKAGLCRRNCHLFLNCENCDLSAAGNWGGVWASLVLACLASQQDVYQGMCKTIKNVKKQKTNKIKNASKTNIVSVILVWCGGTLVCVRRCTVSQLYHIRPKLKTSRFSAIFSRGKLIVIFCSQDKTSFIPAYFPRYPQRAVGILRGKFHLFWLATSSWVLGTRQLSWSTLFWKYFKGFHGAWRGKVLISHSRFIFTRIPHPASRIPHPACLCQAYAKFIGGKSSHTYNFIPP